MKAAKIVVAACNYSCGPQGAFTFTCLQPENLALQVNVEQAELCDLFDIV